MKLKAFPGVGVPTTRRAFVTRMAMGGAVVATVQAMPFAALQAATVRDGQRIGARVSNVTGSDVSGAPVVSFHMDQPYLDMSGRGVPYLPPSGMRSGQALAELSEEVFMSCVCRA